MKPAAVSRWGRILDRRLEEVLHRRGWRSASAYVMSFPKSGGTWVYNLTCELMQAAVQDAAPPVVFRHWRHSPHLRPALYVVRDGRDVVVSLYYHHLRDIALGRPVAAQERRFLAAHLGADADLEDVAGNLPRFIAALAERPHGGILSPRGGRRYATWPAHVAEWHGRQGVMTLRYEALLEDALAPMRNAARHLGLVVVEDDLRAAVERWSFARVTGRAPGTESRLEFRRKGIAGDWRNHFTREAAEAFLAYGGRTLVELGYETDDGWVARLDD